MLELIPQKFIESVIILAIFAVLGLLVMGIKLAIEDEEESKPESKVVRGLKEGMDYNVKRYDLLWHCSGKRKDLPQFTQIEAKEALERLNRVQGA